jgi:hypothetical protein
MWAYNPKFSIKALKWKLIEKRYVWPIKKHRRMGGVF